MPPLHMLIQIMQQNFKALSKFQTNRKTLPMELNTVFIRIKKIKFWWINNFKKIQNSATDMYES